jgi:hypothetical protein
MTSSSEPILKLETKPNKETLDDNARKFVVKSLGDEFLSEQQATSYLLITDWLEMGDGNERKLAYKKYTDDAVQILLISKVTTQDGRVSQKQKIDEEEYRTLLDGSVLHVEKVRHEFNYIQDNAVFEVKYDEFTDSQLRVLEVDAKTDEERAAFDSNNFPAELVEVTGNLQYYGYRVADILGS